MVKRKFYYLIEEIDIDGDTKSDGFLITKYKIDKKNKDKIFLKSKYVSFQNFNKKLNIIEKSLKGGINKKINNPNYPPQSYNNVPYMNNNEFNNYMNNNNGQNQHRVIVAYNNPTMGTSFMNGLGQGLGVGAGVGIMDGIFDIF